MTTDESGSPDAADPAVAARRLSDPNGWERRGAAFEFTAADAEAFARDHRAHLRRRNARPRGTSARAVDRLIGFAFLAFVIAFAVAGFTLTRGYYAEAAENVAAGAILGSGVASTVLLLLGLRVERRKYIDPAWVLTTIRAGVEAGMLWTHKHGALTIFASRSAFIEVVRTDRFILAFVNKSSAHAFPPDRLAASPEGREVLDWFDAHWPARPDPGPAPGGLREAMRRELRRSWRIGWKVTVLLGALGLVVSLVEWATDPRPKLPERDWTLPGRMRSGTGEDTALPALWGRNHAVTPVPDR